MKRTLAGFLVLSLGLGIGAAGAGAAGDKGVGRGDRFSRLKALDADKDGTVTADEFAKAQRERFARRDADKDGVLVPGELVTSRGRADGPSRADRLMKRFDANADGKITREEYDAGAKAQFARRDKDGDGKLSRTEAPRMGRRGGKAQPSTLTEFIDRGAARFKLLDVNGDGAVEAAEAAAADAERQAYHVKRAMHGLDKNGDGKVSPEEFQASAQARFAHLDLDNDGKITAADLPPAVRATWEGR